MPETTPPVPLTLASRVGQVFPILTPEQIARIAVHGQVRHVQRGEVLMETAEQPPRFFVVTAGHPVWHAMSTPPLPPGTLRVRCRIASGMMAGRPPVCSWRRPADVPSPRACARHVDAVCPRTAPETRPVVPSRQQVPIIRHFFSSKCKQCQWLTYGLMLAKVLTVNGRKQHRGQERTAQMTCKIEQHTDGHHTTLRLIGHFQAAYLEMVQLQLESHGPRTVLDLDEVTLVDVEVVRFLGRCEQAGTALLHCPPSVREWIAWEQQR